MDAKLNKEKGLFLAGLLLLAWVGVKFALLLAQPPLPRGKPKVPAPTIGRGERDVLGLLASPPLASYVERGPRVDPFADGSGQPAAVFVRSLVHHSLRPAGVLSRYRFDCRMVPAPVREVRLRLPAGLRAAHVASKELDPKRPYAYAGNTLIVPVVPAALKRGYYRCQVAVLLQQPLPRRSPWVAPAITFRGATDHVVSESGDLAVETPENDVELALATATRKGLSDVQGTTVEGLPPSTFTRAVYHFSQPDYELAIPVKVKGEGDLIAKGGKAEADPTTRKESVTKSAGQKGDDTKRGPDFVVPKPGDLARLPVKLVGLLRAEEPERRPQAVFRDKRSGEFLRRFEGETVRDLRVVAIADDSVTVTDPEGKRYKIPGRFEDKYGP